MNDAERELLLRAEEQYGVVSLRDALAVGMSERSGADESSKAACIGCFPASTEWPAFHEAGVSMHSPRPFGSAGASYVDESARTASVAVVRKRPSGGESDPEAACASAGG